MQKKKISRLLEIFMISGRRYAGAGHAQRAVLLTYYTLFSIVPVAALLFGIAKGFALDKHLQVAIESRAVNHRELLQYINQFAEFNNYINARSPRRPAVWSPVSVWSHCSGPFSGSSPILNGHSMRCGICRTAEIGGAS